MQVQNVTKTILPWVSAGESDNPHRDPQLVRVRDNVKGLFIIDGGDRDKTIFPSGTDFVIYNNLDTDYIQRLKLRHVTLDWCIPNINENNNIINFTHDGTKKHITLPVKNYPSNNFNVVDDHTITYELEKQFETEIPGTLVTTPSNYNNSISGKEKIIINFGEGNDVVFNESNMTVNSPSMFGIPVDNVPAEVVNFTCNFMMPFRYLIVHSNTITRYSRLKSIGTNRSTRDAVAIISPKSNVLDKVNRITFSPIADYQIQNLGNNDIENVEIRITDENNISLSKLTGSDKTNIILEFLSEV